MSKSSQLALVLEEQANELGLTLQEALERGFTYDGYKLVSPTPDHAQKGNTVELEHILNGLDEVLEYLKEECDTDECDKTKDMINNVRNAELFLKDFYGQI